MSNRSHLTGRRAALVAALAAATILGGCHKSGGAPAGQVVATVDGDDVTRRDIQAELAAAKAPANIDMKKVQPLVVDQIVNRKLLVEEAKKEKLDKSPEFLAAEQRARETVMAEMLIQRWGSKLSPPTTDKAQAFIADNPQMFADRKAIVLDQIRTKSDGLDPNALKPLTTNDQVAAYLTQQKHPFERGSATLDSATLPKQTVSQIEGLAPGMPFVLSQNGMVLVNAVVDQKPAPIPEAQWQNVAKQAVGKQALDSMLRDQLKSLRSAAKIEYQDGFAPPKAPTPPADKPAP
jgi:peptidyl-prolyl cis-trans isomerase C